MGVLAVIPGREGHVAEAEVGGRHTVQEAEALDVGDVAHALGLREDGLDLLADLIRALEAGRGGQLHVEEEVAVVLRGHEAAGQGLAQHAIQQGEGRQDHEGNHRLADEAVRERDVAVGGLVQNRIEAIEDPGHAAVHLLPGLEDERRQSRRERQRIEGGDEHGDGDGDGKLFIEPTLDAPQEGHGQEHRRQHQGDAHHRPRDLLHRLEGGLPGHHALLDVVLHSLHHHDGVIHHQADGQHQPEEGQSVDGEAQQGEDRKGADEGNGHGNHGNERGAPVLQEDVDHEDHQQHGLRQGPEDLLDALHDRQGGVHSYGGLQVSGIPLLQVLDLLLHRIAHRQGVGARRLEEGDDAGGLAVEAADLLVAHGAQLDPGHVPEADHGAIRIGADHDLGELFRVLEAALGPHGVGHLLALGHGLGPDLPRGVHGALLLHGLVDVGHGDAQLGQEVRLHPDAHGIVAGAEDDDLAHARDPVERVDDVDGGVVGQEQGVVGGLGRVHGDEHEGHARGLADDHAVLVHIRRQEGLGLGHTVLGVHLVEAHVRRHIEGDRLAHGPIVGVGGLHVEHAVHAVELLLQGRGHGLLDGHRVGARVGGRDLDLGRDDLRELRHRQPAHGHQARDERDDRNHHGHDGAVDEELHHGTSGPGLRERRRGWGSRSGLRRPSGCLQPRPAHRP